MPFFQGARDFDINGGTFYDVAGNQANHKHDNSFQISGSNNSTNFAPNLSRNDNRAYNMDQSYTNHLNHSAGVYNYGGLPHGNTMPAVSDQEYQEYQKFLAWKHQGSLAPNHFQSLHAINAAPPHPQITDRYASNGFSRGHSDRLPSQPYQVHNGNNGQSYPPVNSQFMNSQTRQSSYPSTSSPYSVPPSSYPASSSPYPAPSSPHPSVSSPRPSVSSPHPSVSSPYPASSSYNQPPAGPAPFDHWGNGPNPHPPLDHQEYRRAHSQPILNGAEFMSEPSDVLSDDPDERRFPGEGAISNLETQFRKKANISDPMDQAGSRPRSTPAIVSQPSTHPGNIASPTQSSPFSPQGPSLPPLTQNFRNAQTPAPAPPPPNITTKPQQPQPVASVPYINVAAHNFPPPHPPHPPPAEQSSHNSRLQPSQPRGRPLSSSSSDGDSSDSTNAGNKTTTRPAISAVPITSHAAALPTPIQTQPGPISNVAAMPGFRFDNPSPLSPQGTNVSGGSAANPSAVVSPLSPPSVSASNASASDPGHINFPSAGVFSGLQELPTVPAPPEKKKKKKLLERFGLKKSKPEKTL